MTYEEIADKEELAGNIRHRYLLYMRSRWSNPQDEDIKCQTGYASEWAIRFKENIEWICSDTEGKRLLVMIDEGILKKL